MSLTTKQIATVFVGVGLVLGLSFAFATPVKADLLTDLQAQVQALLAQIANLSGGSVTTGGTCNTFTRNHQMGDTGGEVMWIQQFLNTHGAQISASGAGSPGNETSYFGSLTRAAVSKFQAANGITPSAGYWGPITRAKANSMCTSTPGTGVPGVPVTGNGLKVMLASDSPANQTLVQGQAIGELAKFTFSNPTGSEITITSIGFKRTGASSDSTLTNVYLFQGATRLTDAAGISSGSFTFNDTAGIVKVPAGGSVTVSVRADITASTGGSTLGVQLVSVGSSGTLDSSVVLPISGANLLISSASMGTVAFTYNGPTSGSENPGNDIRVFQASTAVSSHAAWLQTITFENRGTSDNDDIKNLKLYVDGTQVGSAIGQLDSRGKATFDLSSNPLSLSTQTHEIKVVADIVGGSGKTFDVQIRRAADVRLVDVELNQPILATDAGGSFPVSAAAANSIGAASLSVVKAANSPTSNVAVGATNALWARFEFRASGDNVKVEALKLWSDQGAADGMDNAKVFLNGVQVGSTKDISADTNPDNDGTEFTFGSSFIARQGLTEIVEIYGDAKTEAGVNYADATTVDIGLSIAAADTEGMDSGDSVTAISEVEGNSITISSSTATLTKYSGYGNQTLVAGTNNARLGSFTISTGSTEGVNVNTLTITLSSDESASVTDLMLKRSDTGAQLGTTKVAPGTSNSFSVNLPIVQSGTVTIDVYANIKSSANAGSWIAAVDGSGTGAVTSSTVTLSSVTLQTITVGSGSLTVTRDPGTPVNSNVVAGLTNVHVGKFDFAAVSSSYTVQELMVKVPANSATSVSNVTLKYKNQAGVEQTVSRALALSADAQSHATATFTGLTFYVPQNDSADLDVYVDTPTVSSGASSGVAISVALENDTGFKAIDGAGSSDTTLNATAASDIGSNDSSGYGTKYVKKTVPTLARLSTGYTANTVASGIGLFRFTVTADAAGAVDWREISFDVSTSGMDAGDQLINWTLYDVTGSAVAVNSTAANATNTPYVISICPDTSCTVGEAQQIGAGTTKTYELRAGTVTGWADSGDSLTISFKQDDGATTNVAASSLHSGQNMVWSDRSANSHATTTADWTNGYLVKDTDNDVRSCQFGTVTSCTP
ncbi:peptidoglycan-binding protein [Candidatus Kaiserbacteria bacterium]|nr:peptidoglycan-binding protein [Candidatus Kaiserbacteria bacterium]